jgi:hypothetical protein
MMPDSELRINYANISVMSQFEIHSRLRIDKSRHSLPFFRRIASETLMPGPAEN